jgi:hypothetical protein
VSLNATMIGRFWWSIFDDSGAAHALVTGCRQREHAERIAASFFPELASFQCVPWGQASLAQRCAAHAAMHITPIVCRRLGIEPPPNALPQPPQPPTLEKQVKRLQRHFAHTAGGVR